MKAPYEQAGHRERGLTPAEDQEVARLAAVSGWRVAAHDYMRSLDQQTYRLAVDEYGAGLRFLLPLTAESRVLHMRSGWGVLPLNVAHCVASVVAMDDRSTRLEFARARSIERPAGNLHLVQGSLGSDLPFAADSFDTVIMLDAAEHLPQRKGLKSKSAWAILTEACRVLTPGGSLLLGVANRLGFARPRASARERLLTYWGYNQALVRAGFSGLQFFAPLPSQYEPFFILPLDRWRLVNHFVDGIFTAQDYRSKLQARGLGHAYRLAWAAWRLGRRLRLTGLARYVVPSYLILAYKGSNNVA